MDASKKQREPVAFKSLAELKRFIRPGVEFKTVSHANHADMVGLTRVVTTVQTVGFYSKIKDQPEHPFSTCNHGKGFYTDFGKAGNYIFDGTTVKVKDTRKQDRGVIYELEFYDREQNMSIFIFISGNINIHDPAPHMGIIGILLPQQLTSVFLAVYLDNAAVGFLGEKQLGHAGNNAGVENPAYK